MAVMQDDWVMMALPFFFGALALEVLWAYNVTTKHYESVDFWTSMRVMLLTVFVDLIPKAIGIGLMFAVYSLSPLKGLVDTSWYCSFREGSRDECGAAHTSSQHLSSQGKRGGRNRERGEVPATLRGLTASRLRQVL